MTLRVGSHVWHKHQHKCKHKDKKKHMWTRMTPLAAKGLLYKIIIRIVTSSFLIHFPHLFPSVKTGPSTKNVLDRKPRSLLQHDQDCQEPTILFLILNLANQLSSTSSFTWTKSTVCRKYVHCCKWILDGTSYFNILCSVGKNTSH